jgi:transcriptional regulator with XRE-family HTH domain
VTQNGTWPDRFVRSIALEIRRYRKERKMSAQQLADECERRGLPMKRSVLANLESGRRTTLSVPELIILADVLQIPPALLLYPLGYAELIEVLPGQVATPEQAMGWLVGNLGPAGGAPGPENSVDLYREHVYAVSSCMAAVQANEKVMARAAEVEGFLDLGDLVAEDYEAARRRQDARRRRLVREWASEREASQRQVAAAVDLVQSVRRRMRNVGMTVLPTLPEALIEADIEADL